MIRSRLAREKAANILSMYQINETPIDVEFIAKQLGFEVHPFSFPDEISAAIKTIGSLKVIGINDKHPKTRQRFSIAHELGHYLSGHEEFDEDKRAFVDPSKKFLNPQFRQEEEADEFAAELLMPETLLTQDVLANHLDLPELAKKYEVSEQAMTIQLVNLKLPFNQGKK
jgi:Zn-dependent peptidase ImmA (M78 family)